MLAFLYTSVALAVMFVAATPIGYKDISPGELSRATYAVQGAARGIRTKETLTRVSDDGDLLIEGRGILGDAEKTGKEVVNELIGEMSGGYDDRKIAKFGFH